MKTIVLAALAVLGLGISGVVAQGVPAGGGFAPAHYGASAFDRNNQSIFSWKVEDQSKLPQQVTPAAAPGSADQNLGSSVPAAKGG